MKRVICTLLICFLAVVGITTVTDVLARKQIRNDFVPNARQYISNKTTDLITVVDRVGTDTTLTALHHNVFVDTDTEAVTITLPAGVLGTEYRLVNVGTSTNNLTIVADGTEEIIGTSSNYVLTDSEALILVYETAKGWY